jgi:hypothetical protein
VYDSLQFTVAHHKNHLRLVESPTRAAALDRPSPFDERRARVAIAADTPDAADSVPAYSVRRCILCGATHINATAEGRIVTVQCHACDAMFKVEYDPPDSPTLRGRIEVISRRD